MRTLYASDKKYFVMPVASYDGFMAELEQAIQAENGRVNALGGLEAFIPDDKNPCGFSEESLESLRQRGMYTGADSMRGRIVNIWSEGAPLDRGKPRDGMLTSKDYAKIIIDGESVSLDFLEVIGLASDPMVAERIAAKYGREI